MSLLFAAALAASTTTLPICSWDRPGANPFMGNVVAAVDRYGDIPESVRATLKKRMAERRYDDVAVIRRDSIAGKHRYSPEIRDMHFGPGQVCRTVTRSQWAATAEERGLVYCESGHCIIVPTVCRNVSRVTRMPPDRKAAAADEAPPAAGSSGSGATAGAAVPAVELASAAAVPVAADPANAGELAFEAPGAGLSFAQQSDPAQPGQRVSTSTLPGANDGGTPISPVNADGNYSAFPVTGGGSSYSRGAGGGGGSIGWGEGGGWRGVPAASTSPSGDPVLPGTGPGGTLPGGPSGPFNPGGTVTSPVTPPVSAVPEPGTWALWLLGLAALALAARRRQPISS